MKGFNKDLSKWKQYDYVVVNDDLKKCYTSIMQVIKNKNKKKILYDNDFIKSHIKKLLK